MQMRGAASYPYNYRCEISIGDKISYFFYQLPLIKSICAFEYLILQPLDLRESVLDDALLSDSVCKREA